MQCRFSSNSGFDVGIDVSPVTQRKDVYMTFIHRKKVTGDLSQFHYDSLGA